MENSHNHSHKSGISLAFWLNLLFSIIEIIGGTLINSAAIIADAFHDFIDAAAIGLAVILEKISGKKRTSKFSYGYKRFSLLSALGLSIFLLTGSIIMVVSAYKSFLNPEAINSTGMLWLAILGIAVNGFAFIRIKQSNGHSSHHHHGHQSSHTQNSKAIMLHLLEGVLGWIAVLIGAAVIYFTNWYWIDGILTLAIALFIGFNATKNLTGTMKILLQSVPEGVNIDQLSTDLSTIEGIENIHNLHIWSIDGSYNIGSLHAVINFDNKEKEVDIFSSIMKLLEKHQIHHPTIQIETTVMNCKFITC